MNNMRRGFTMIELIFVIVIIGILAAVAVPKLAENRDDATAATCAEDIGNIITEVTTEYEKLGYTDFQKLTVKELTNVKTASGPNDIGLTQGAGDNVVDGLSYSCTGIVAKIKFKQNKSDKSIYEMTISTANASTTVPAAIKAAKIVEKDYNMVKHEKVIAL